MLRTQLLPTSRVARPLQRMMNSTTAFPGLTEIRSEELVGRSFGNNDYHVARSQFGRLPVYTDFKRGRNIVTEIKNIEGDVVQLKRDLMAAIPEIPKDNIKANLISQKIIIKGNFRQDVLSVLEKKF